MITPVEPAADPSAERRRLGLRWWREVVYVLVFYLVYSAIRNRFGSAAVEPAVALDNAREIIDLERAMGLYVEETIQSWFVSAGAQGFEYTFTGARQFLQFWNVFYGTFHFVLTAVALIWLFRSFPADYPRWRNTLAVTTLLALLGFSLYPLMPPRLLTDCGPYGACLEGFSYIDTLADIGGLWSFDSGTMQQVSNQYAAMPSLHFGWSLWCLLVLYPRLRRWWTRALVVAYPVLTLWAVMVTANHYWLDAAGGAVIVGLGYVAGSTIARLTERRRELQTLAAVDLRAGDSPPPSSDGHPGAWPPGPTADTVHSEERTHAPTQTRVADEAETEPAHVPRDDQQPG